MARRRDRLPYLVATLLVLVAIWLAMQVDRSSPVSIRAAPAVRHAPHHVDDDTGSPAVVGRTDDAPPDPSAGPRPFRGVDRTLDNGLTVLLVPDHNAPTIAAHLVVKVGAVDDPEDALGAAHFLEHMLFKGSDRLGTADWAREKPHIDALRTLYDDLALATDPDERTRIEDAIAVEHAAADVYALPNEFARLLDEIGAQWNATTSLEYTDYFAQIPANRLEVWARLEAERMTSPVFRGLTNERRVVGEEVRYRSSHAEVRSIGARRMALFGDHPYGRPIGGTEDTVADTTMRDLEAFWDRWYVPSNAAVVLVGDFDPSDAWRTVDDAFGDLPAMPAPSRRLPPVVTWPPAPIRVHGGIHDGLQMSWAVGDLSAAEWAALGVALQLLERDIDGRGQTVSARFRIARYTVGGRVDLSGFCFTTLAQCEEAARDAIAAASTLEPAERAIASARWSTEIARLKLLESHLEQADAIANGFGRGEHLEDGWREVLLLRAVTPTDVRDVAKRVFGEAYALADGEPDDAPSRPRRDERAVATDIEDSRTSALFDELLALPVAPLPDTWLEAGRDYTAAERVVAAPNPYNHLFQMTLTWPLGWATDPVRCHALSHWERKASESGGWGTPLWRGGVSLSTACGPDRTLIALDGPGASAEAAVAAVKDALRTPVFVLDRPRRSAGYGAALAYAGYGRASPFLLFHPTLDELSAAGPSRLAHALSLLASTRPEIEWVGTRDAASVAAWFPGIPLEEREPWAPDPPAATRILVAWGVITRVSILRWGEPYDPAREGLYALYDAWLSGSSGIVSETLREQRALIYSLDSTYERGRHPGERDRTLVEFNVRPDRVADAVQAALEALTTPSVTGSRWAHVAAETDEVSWSGHIPFRQVPGEVLAWQRHGFDADPRAEVQAALADLDRAAFDAFLAAEARTPVTVLVEGELSAAARADLERIAPVETLDRSDILR